MGGQHIVNKTKTKGEGRKRGRKEGLEGRTRKKEGRRRERGQAII